MQLLDKIAAQTRALVAERKTAKPLAMLQAQIEAKGAPPRPFARALAAAPTGLIFECKGASPSEGVIRADYDPAAIARDYQHVATCISVLTATPYFRGSFAHLAAVREAVQQPLLCKDFMLEGYQLYEARTHGADAILLICALLSAQQLRDLSQLAHSLGMDALVEAHDAEELELALACGARLVGINNRNLKTMQISLEVTEQLAGSVPRGVTLIAESGVSGRADVKRLGPLVDGMLIGTHLMRREDIAVAARELAYGRVKVCGLTRSGDAQAAWRAGATFGGLIFAEASPRKVSLEIARQLVGAAPLRWVGVFVDEETKKIVEVARELDLAAVQLHGAEPPAQLAELRASLPTRCEIWKAFCVGEGETPPLCRDTGADRLLLDAHHPGVRGGSGRSFDWRAVREHPDRDQLILAGGIGPENAREADALGVWALDASSKLEKEPGIKDPAKLAALFGVLRGESAR